MELGVSNLQTYTHTQRRRGMTVAQSLTNHYLPNVKSLSKGADFAIPLTDARP